MLSYPVESKFAKLISQVPIFFRKKCTLDSKPKAKSLRLKFNSLSNQTILPVVFSFFLILILIYWLIFVFDGTTSQQIDGTTSQQVDGATSPQADGASTQQESVLPTILEVDQSAQFFGNSFITDNFSRELLDQPYTVQFLLKSEQNDVRADYDKNTPPMPMLIGPIAVYQISPSEYHIIVKSESDATPASIIISDANEWNHVAIVISEHTASFFLNGTLVKEDTSTSPLVSPKAVIGKGFHERFWKGQIAYAGISVGEEYENIFIPPTNVSDLDDSIEWIYLFDGASSPN